MLSPRAVLALSLGAAAVVLAWASAPPDTITLNKNCRPLGASVMASLVYGADFWHGQQRLLSQERSRLLALPARLDMAREAESKDRTHLDDRLNRLSKGAPEDEERAQAAAEHRRAERLAWVLKCESWAASQAAGHNGPP